MLENVQYKIASALERDLVLRFRDRIYADELGSIPRDDVDSVAEHLIALEPPVTILASFRVVLSHCRPFEFEQFVPIDHLLTSTSVPAWIGRLCVDADKRQFRRNQLLHFNLLKLLYLSCAAHQITDLVLYCAPRLVAFYRSLHFSLVGEAFDHPIWGQQQVMYANVAELRSRHLNSASSLSRFLTGPVPANFQVG